MAYFQEVIATLLSDIVLSFNEFVLNLNAKFSLQLLNKPSMDPFVWFFV